MNKKMILTFTMTVYMFISCSSAYSCIARLIYCPHLSATMFRHISSKPFSHFLFFQKNDGCRDKVINELVRIFIVRSFVVLGELVSKETLSSDQACIFEADTYLIENIKKYSLLEREIYVDFEDCRKKISDQFGDGSFFTDERAEDIIEENASIFVKNILQSIKNHEDSTICIL